MSGTNDFNFIPDKDLSSLLKPYQPDRLLKSDVDRANSLPSKITEGTRFKGLVEVLFYANGSAGTFTQQIMLNLDSAPLTMVWFLGNFGQGATGSTVGGGLLPGNYFNTDAAGQGIPIFSGATGSYMCNKESLTLIVKSTNVGWSDRISALFYYSVFYDEIPNLKEYYGL